MSDEFAAVDGTPTVLLVEDETGLADLYASWLDDTCTVDVAETAAAGRERFDSAFDVALVDRRLPDAPGDEVLDWIREREPRCRTAVVSAIAPGRDLVDLPVDDYLVKPIEKTDLREVVATLSRLDEYDDAVRELYRLTAKRATLADVMERCEHESTDAYRHLESRIADARDAVERDTGEFDGEELLEVNRRSSDSRKRT